MTNGGVADLNGAFEFDEFEFRHHVGKVDGEIRGIHLAGKDFFEAFVGAVQAVDRQLIARDICGSEKGKTLNVVPMRVADKEMNMKRLLLKLAKHSHARFAHAGAAVEEQNRVSAANFNARRIPAE